MAWKGKVAKKTVDQASGTFTLDVDFYDDVDPATVLSRQQVPIQAGTTLAEIQLKVRSLGAEERTKHNQLKNLNDSISLGQEVTV